MTEKHCKGVHICLVGPNRLQNELFVAALKKIHNCENSFVVAQSLSDIPSEVFNNTRQIILGYLDCFGLGQQEIESRLLSVHQRVIPVTLLALFNLAENTGCERAALSYGIRGFFYPGSTPDDFCRGTRAILKGEVWLPRKAISEILFCCLSPAPNPPAERKNPANLSARETKVLTLLGTGATNKTIAGDLCISVHTVRTHLYHIYKKINVTNRSQAILWAKKNF